MGHTRPLRWLCGCEPPSQDVDQGKQPRAATEREGFQKEIRGGGCRLLLSGGGRAPPSVPASWLPATPPAPQTPCFPWRHPLGSSALWHASSLKTEEDFLPRQVVSLLRTLNVFLTMSVTIRFDYHVMGTAQDSRPAVGEFTIRGPGRPGCQRCI